MGHGSPDVDQKSEEPFEGHIGRDDPIDSNGRDLVDTIVQMQ